MRFQRTRVGFGYTALVMLCMALFFSGSAVAAIFDFSVQASISGPLQGVKVYAFTETGSYTGLDATTDATGSAQFIKEDFADGQYRFRIDYLSEQYWSADVFFPLSASAGITIDESEVVVTVSDSSVALYGINIYLFNEAGTYLNRNAGTNSVGQAGFVLPLNLSVKIRADYMGYQFWSETAVVAPAMQIAVQIPSQQINVTVQGSYQGQIQPFEGINTYLFKPPSSYLGITQVTDSTGKVTFNLPEQVYRVRADYLGQQYWSNEFSAADATIDIPLADAQITVTGNGLPLPGVATYVFSASGAYLGLSQTTDAAGLAVFRLPAGAYQFRVDYQSSQYWSATETLIADAANPVAVSTGGGTFVLKVLKGLDQPLSGINCYVFSEGGSYLGMTSATDASGDAAFNLADGNYKIRIDHLGYQDWTDVFAVPAILSDTHTIAHHDAVISVNSIYQGSVDPLENIPVYLFVPAGSYQGISSATDAAGQALINIPVNAYKVRADYMGRQYWSAESAGSEFSIDIPAGIAQVHVTGSGQVLADVPVYVYTAAGSYLGVTGSTDAAGDIAFNLPAGEYRFRADYQGNQYWTEAVVADNMVNPVAIHTGGGVFTLSITDGSASMENIQVYVFNPQGAYLGMFATTDASGDVTFDLSDGTYRFRVDHLGYQFWSPDYTIPDTLASTFSIPHQDITVTVQRDYPTTEPLEGVPTYLFTAAGAYMGLNAVTNSNGQAVYRLPYNQYKVRADYRGGQFWSDVLQPQNATLTIAHGIAEIHVSETGSDLAGVPVYLFSTSGAYLGWSEVTDASGKASFLVPAQSYKFRVDENGEQHWSPVVAVTANQTNPIPIDVDPLTVSLTADPETIDPGQSASLIWTSIGAESCVIEPDIGSVALNGTLVVTPVDTITYTITATKGAVTTSSSVTVTVNASTGPTDVSGLISSDTTWTLTGSPYIVTGDIDVRGTDGADSVTTLTIEPGVVIKMDSGTDITIGTSSDDPGALVARGTVDNPIVFSSNEASPAPGDWDYIYFRNTTSDSLSIVEHCIVEYGGRSNGALYAYRASPTIRNVTVRNSDNYGARFSYAGPIVENCHFSDNQNYDLYYYETSGGSVIGTTINNGIYATSAGTAIFYGNTINQNNDYPITLHPDYVGQVCADIRNADSDSFMTVSSGVISHDGTWTAVMPYYLTQGVTVKGQDGGDSVTTLTVEPGAVIKMGSYINLTVGSISTLGDPGALVAQGTADNPILFTSSNTSPAPGDWGKISFANKAYGAGTILEHCLVEYGGSNNGAISISKSSPLIRNVTVKSSGSYGAYVNGGNPVFEDCIFSGNQNYDLYHYDATAGGSVSGSTFNSGIFARYSGTVSFSANIIYQNNAFPITVHPDYVGQISASTFYNVDAASFITVRGSVISHDAVWTAVLPYYLYEGARIEGQDGDDNVTTLTIEPGAVIRMGDNRGITVGSISTLGDPGALVARGTADNPILFTSIAASPVPGDWDTISFTNKSYDAGTIMEHCIVEYGGRSDGALHLSNASPTIRNSLILNNNDAGIYATGAANAAVITCNIIVDNEYGIHWQADPPLELHSNNIFHNANYEIYYTGGTILIAENNWWGDSAGPNPDGSDIYGNVDADPWSIAGNQCEGFQNYPPFKPWAPSPAAGAVHVSIDSGVTLSWNGQDPNVGDTLTYDLYIGQTADTLTLEAADLSDATYVKNGVLLGTTYYWQVVAKDDQGLSTSSIVWGLTTDDVPSDLAVSALTTTPAGGMPPGSTVIVTATIANSGSGLIVDGFTVQFSANGEVIGSGTIDQFIAPGADTQISFDYNYSGGDALIHIFADSEQAIAETDESNNQLETTLSTIADITAPMLMGHSPADNSHHQQVQQISFSLMDTQSDVDTAAVLSAFVMVDSSQQPLAGTISAADNVFTFVPDSLPLADDTYQVSISAADTFGNTQLYTFSFTVDVLAPSKPVITGGYVNSGIIQPRPAVNTADLMLAVIEGTRDAQTSLWINGELIIPIGSGPWSFTVELIEGNNEFEIYSMDAAGNLSLSEWVDITFIRQNDGDAVSFEYDDAGRLKRIQPSP